MGKKGKLYFRLIVAVAILTAAIYAYSVIASALAATPVIVNNNASIALANQQLFLAANFSAENASQEVNSTFKWFKRTLYQPQNRLVVMPL